MTKYHGCGIERVTHWRSDKLVDQSVISNYLNPELTQTVRLTEHASVEVESIGLTDCGKEALT